MKYTTYFISIFILYFSVLGSVGAIPISLSTDTGFDSQSSDVIDRFCRRSDCAKSPSFDKLNVDASRKRDNSVDVLANGIVTRLYTQPLDHTNNAKGFFLQRYYVNDTFYKPGGPIFCKYSKPSCREID